MDRERERPNSPSVFSSGSQILNGSSGGGGGGGRGRHREDHQGSDEMGKEDRRGAAQ